MTVSNQTNRTTGTIGTGEEQTVAFTFPIVSNSDIVVKTIVTTTGVEETLTETTHYVVTNNGEDGGSILTVDPFVSADKYIHIIRKTPRTQTLDLEDGGAFSAENIEDALDKVTKLAIENKDGLDRCVRMPDCDSTATNSLVLPSAADRASKYLLFNSAGVPTAATAVDPGDVTMTATGTALAEAANAAAARTTLALGDVATLNIDTDGTLDANSDTVVATQKATKTYVDTEVATAAILDAENTFTAENTFDVFPITPSDVPDADYEVVNKKYVDDSIDAAGSIVKIVNTTITAVNDSASNIAYSDDIPDIGDGLEVLTRAIKPAASANKLMIEAIVHCCVDTNDITTVALFQDATAAALAATGQYTTANSPETIVLRHYMEAGTTDSTTFRIRIGGASGTITFNGSGTNRRYGGVCASSITITEIAV